MKRTRDFIASRIHRHYFTAPGYYRHFITSGIVLSLIGVVMLVTLAAFRFSTDQAEAHDTGSASQFPSGKLVLEVSAPSDSLPALAASIREIPEVELVTELRSGFRWLSAWNAEGGPTSFAPAGYSIPIDVGAVNPQEYQELLPPQAKGTLLDLGVGAILSRTAAELRGITEKGNLRFGGIDIPVMAVLDDELTRHHEMIITSANADGFGIQNNRYLAVVVSSYEDGREVTVEIEKKLPSGVPTKVYTPRNSGYGDGPGLLSTGEIKKIFGEFPGRPAADGVIKVPQSWVDEHISEEHVPLLGVFKCNRQIFPLVRAAMEEIERQDLGRLVHAGDFGGCYSSRFIRSGAGGGISRHSWGIAVDLNVSHNLMGRPPKMDQRIVNIMGDFGFSWGGDWTVPDGMHFEFVRMP